VRLALIAERSTPTNRALCRAMIDGAAWEELTPHQALEALRPGDGALGRLDVLPTLDGVDDGLWALGALAARGVQVLNDPAALLATHDKLLTARLLRRHSIAHPLTIHLRDGRAAPPFVSPVVVKPRFGSWGREVYRCDDADALAETLALIGEQSWFQRHGALLQQLVPPRGYDLRVLVAAGRVVGAVHRIAAPGEWRTNVALGAVRRTVDDVPREAAAIAAAAACVSGASLVGVDLLPGTDGGWCVLELNGAVEFTAEYSEWCDVFAETALLLGGEVYDRQAHTGAQAMGGALH
jgi:RimK family alpha-L-glutamate ligase